MLNGIKKILETKESGIESYFKIGRRYYSKKLIWLLVIAIILVIFALYLILSLFSDKLLVFQEGSSLIKTFSGKAKLLSKSGTVKYVGVFAEGLYSGKGEEYYSNTVLKYNGEFKSGDYSGEGKLYTETGKLLYSGAFVKGAKSGQGTEFFENGKLKYVGDFKNNAYNGSGTQNYDNGSVYYEGSFQNGIFSGKGSKYFPDGLLMYIGQFDNGLYNGEGIEYYGNGKVKYKGLFLDGKYEGEGLMYDENGTTLYKGNFSFGMYSGEGTEYSSSGSVKYNGLFFRGQYSGAGKLYSDTETLLYDGTFKEGLYDSSGSLYDSREGLVFKGLFKENAPYIQGFLGVSESKLKELAGDPATQPADTNKVATTASDVADSSLTAQNTLQISLQKNDYARNNGYIAPTGHYIEYDTFSMSFVLEASSSQPKKFFVSAVKLWGNQELFGARLDMDTKSIISLLGEPYNTYTFSENGIGVIGFIKDEYLVKFYYSISDNSVLFAELSKSIPNK